MHSFRLTKYNEIIAPEQDTDNGAGPAETSPVDLTKPQSAHHFLRRLQHRPDRQQWLNDRRMP